jgi:hypothetical protein
LNDGGAVVGKPVSGVARTSRAIVRLTEEQHERWKAAAARDGKDLSDWLRDLAEARCAAQGAKGKARR